MIRQELVQGATSVALASDLARLLDRCEHDLTALASDRDMRTLAEFCGVALVEA